MRSKISMWGGSLAVRIPQMAVETLGLQKGSSIDIHIQDEALILKKSMPSYCLEELVNEAKQHQKPESFDDQAVGDEEL